MKIILSLFALLYVLSPYDLFPDFFVGLGWLDDLLLLFLLWWYVFVYRKRQVRSGGTFQKDEPSHGQKNGQGERDHDKSRSRNDFKKNNAMATPYSVLGITEGASQEEIKNAYRKMVNQYHPDKVSHLGEEFRDLAERRFKEIQEAYQTLTTS